MKNIFRMFCVVMCVIILFSFAACDRNSAKDVESTEEKLSADGTTMEDTTVFEDEPVLAVLPEEYADVIADYEKLVEFRYSEDFITEWNNGNYGISDSYFDEEIRGNFGNMIGEMPVSDGRCKDDFGYILKDINEDGIPELFWVDTDYNIYAIFTYDERAKLLDAFWPRYKGFALDSGDICTHGSGGAYYNASAVYSLDDSLSLTTKIEFGTDYDSENDRAVYYEMIDDVETEISEERYNKLYDKYPKSRSEDRWYENEIYDFEGKVKPREYYYLIEDSVENLISIKVPVFYGDLAEKINKTVSEFIASRFSSEKYSTEFNWKVCPAQPDDFNIKSYMDDYSNYCVNIHNSNNYFTDDLISIVFEGQIKQISAAHPINVLYSLNIDANSGERVLFADIYDVDENFYKIFLKYAQTELDTYIKDGTESASVEELCSMDEFIEGVVSEEGVWLYFTEESVVICYEVPFAIGGYREVEIPKAELVSFLNNKKGV